MMKVGDIGVLQNITWCEMKHLNGTTAEILELQICHEGRTNKETGVSGGDHTIYKIRDVEGDVTRIDIWEIRPLTDPDAEQETTREMELVL